MLILQVALGIVLAVLILAFLPALLNVGFWVLVTLAGLGIAGFLIYLILDNPILMILAIAVVIVLIVREHRKLKGGEIMDLEVIRDQMQRRAILGYETKSLEEKINKELNKRKFDSAAQRERARRRALGYPK
jgi:uncharacterized membrane protein